METRSDPVVIVGDGFEGRAAARPRFDGAIGRDGYRWFYLDGVSDDGEASIVVIAMLGNVFSPRRARERERDRREAAHGMDFCTMNVSLRSHAGAGRGGRRREAWAMTERTRKHVQQSERTLRIGQSGFEWRPDGSLVASLDEHDVPFGKRLRGRVIFRPDRVTTTDVTLDESGRHHWYPLAPSGRIDVHLDAPDVHFTGAGYFDSNAGDVPLEYDFRSWSWSRIPSRHGVEISYDVTTVAGKTRSRGLTLTHDGDVQMHTDGATRSTGRVTFPRTQFGLEREVGAGVTLVHTLEDGPFYARSLIRGVEGGLGVHETVSLKRLEKPWVRFLVPFRMRRGT